MYKQEEQIRIIQNLRITQSHQGKQRLSVDTDSYFMFILGKTPRTVIQVKVQGRRNASFLHGSVKIDPNNLLWRESRKSWMW